MRDGEPQVVGGTSDASVNTSVVPSEVSSMTSTTTARSETLKSEQRGTRYVARPHHWHRVAQPAH